MINSFFPFSPFFCVQVSELQGKMDFLSESMVDRTQVNRLESKVRELDAKLDLEQTTKNKLEVWKTTPLEYRSVMSHWPSCQGCCFQTILS